MRQLFLIGGYTEGSKLFAWWMNLAGKTPTVCFIPTASGDSEEKIALFVAGIGMCCKAVKVLRLFNRDVADIDAFLADVDIVYVSGGNTANMLAIWRVHGVDEALRRAYDRGVIVGGVSAGALAFANGGTTDSFGPLAILPKTLAFSYESVSPHHDEPGRRELFEAAISNNQLPTGYGLDNGTAILFKDERIAGSVSESPSAHVWTTFPGRTERLCTDQL